MADTRALPTGTVTLLFTDVEGSTRHWQRDPDAMERADVRHRQLLHDAIAEHGGALPQEQGEGDSIVAAFGSAHDALAAACAAQRRLAAEPWETSNAIRVRMAVHTGEARLRGSHNYAGESMIRTARLRALAAGGQVLVSRTTAEAVGDDLDGGIELRSLGEARLKDLRRPEHVFQLVHPDLANDFPPLRGVEAFPNNLPNQLSSFIGREADLAQVHALIEDVRLLTLTGSGGCGKTRLALQVAADRLELHPDGVWYVELAPLGDDSAIISTLATAMSLHVPADRSPLEAVLDELADRRALLVVDNCEHLLGGAAQAISTLLERLPAIRVLATSRQPLNLPGETSWRVPSLGTPHDEPVDVERLGQYDAVRLFVDRALQARPDFTVTNDNAASVASICGALDGIPLAIELAASRVRSMPVERIERALTDRFRLLSGGSAIAPTRQQTLRASVDWSHGMLTGEQQTVFRRLSQFAGGFSLPAAEAVAADDEIDAYAVFDIMTALVDRSLVVFDIDAERYRLLETMKQYGHEQLQAVDEVAVVRARHATHFAGEVAAHADRLTTGEQIAVRTQLDLDHDNLRLALEWFEHTGDGESLAAMAAPLTFYWMQTGRFHEGATWLERGAAAAPDSAHGARCVWGRGYLAFYFGDFALAHEVGIEAERVGREVGDPLAIARAIDLQADVTQLVAPIAGVESLLEALEIARETGDAWTIADITQKIGFSQLFVDHEAETRRWLAQAQETWEPLGNPFFAGWHYNALAWCAVATGRADAVEVADLGRRWSADSGDPQTEAFGAWQQVEARLLVGDVEGARIVTDEAAAAFERRHIGGLVPLMMMMCRGLVDDAVGRSAGAAAQIAPAVEAMRDEGVLVPELVWGLPWLAARWCQEAGAIEPDAERLLECAEQVGTPRRTGDALRFLAACRLDAGDPAAALQLLTRAYEMWGSSFDPVRSESLRLAAWAFAQSGDAPTASTLLATADAVAAESGWAVATHARAWSDAAINALGDGYDAGASAVTLDDAVALALRGRGRRLRPATGWQSLTPTELQVAELVTEGLSNPAIGERLFISRSTVKTHLAHIFTKLDITSRAELAALMTEHR